MTDRKEVEAFLKDFKLKLSIWGLLTRSDRLKNLETLTALEFRFSDLRRELERLQVSDYSEGPLRDVLYNESEMWVFGKIIKGQEVYIKITMGLPGSSVICISFHFPEFAMQYPFKIKS